jgi:DNA polymerase III subunit delta'
MLFELPETKPTYTSNWAVYGHEWAVEHLTRSLNAGRTRHAYLITGVGGIGKTKFARAFAQVVNCLHPEIRPCRQCRACTLIEAGNYADVSIIEAEESSLKIEQVRDMQRSLSLRPVEARYRVVILRHFHNATPQAMDALLKTLEEPPPYVMLLLTADTTDSILPTIKSRCQPINLRPLPVTQVRRGLEEFFETEPERAALLAQLSGGRVGWAVNAVTDESLLESRKTRLDQLEAALGQSRVGRFGLAEAMSKDKSSLEDTLTLWLSYWRDALLLAHSTTTPIANRDRRHGLEQVARSVPIEDITRALNGVRRTMRYLDQNANTRLAVEVLMLDLPKVRVLPAP